MNIYFPLHTKRGILITPKMLQQSELEGSKLQTRVIPGAVVTLSDEMAALELIETIISLKQLENELLGELGESCDKSDLGGSGCKQCLAGPGQKEHICLPGWMLKEAGISKEANLSWDIDKKDHVIRFWLDEDGHNLRESLAEGFIPS